MNKSILYICVFLVSCFSALADYWQRVENLPAGFQKNYYLDVYFLPSNPNYGWICGYDSKILRTTDGGKTWYGSHTSNQRLHLESIHFVNESIGYCSGVEGIFKTRDGGRTWIEITDPNMGSLWGCYFVNADVGVVVGEGCLDHRQKFWHTRDAGNTWTLSMTNELNSGMTDAIIYDPEGLAYAVGSGKLFKSNDGGQSWEKLSDTEVSDRDNRWHEEITNINQSFLLPASGYSFSVGNACQGGERGGGMYFTTDLGTTWNVTQTATPMYGSFLLSETSGWVCGYDGLVLYTSNAGQNWRMKNCGINNHHTDDIFFIDEYNAWVVGDGVWKLSRDSNAIIPERLDFGVACFPDEVIDTLYYYNYSFELSEVKFELVDNYENAFTLLSPNSGSYIVVPPCEKVELIVKFTPDEMFTRTAKLKAQSPGKPDIYADIKGIATRSTIVADTDSLLFGNVYAKVHQSKKVNFTAKNNGEYIEEVKPNIEHRGVYTDFKTKKNITNQGTPINFNVYSKDTGAIAIDYLVKIQPCNRDTTIKLRAYVVSSIINANNAIIKLRCPPKPGDTVSIPFWNSGNHFLQIDSITTNRKESILMGFEHSQVLPSTIDIGGRSAFRISLPTDVKSPLDTILVKIYNNDSTLYYHYIPPPKYDTSNTIIPKNPYYVKIILKNDYAKLDLSRKDKEKFLVCVGDSAVTKFTVENNTDIDANYTLSAKLKNCKYSTFEKIGSNYSLAKKRKEDYVLTLNPLDTGAFSAVLYFKSKDCDILDSLVFEGTAYKVDISTTPKQIDITKKTDRDETVIIDVKSSGFGVITLDSIICANSNKNLQLSVKYDKKVVFIDSTTMKLEIKISSDLDGIYYDTVCFHFSGICQQVYKLPVIVRSISSQIAVNNTTNFIPINCEKRTEHSFIHIINAGDETETIDSILIDNPAFKLIDFKAPMPLEPGKEYKIKVSFAPSDTGVTSGSADIYTDKLKKDYKSVTLLGTFNKTDISISKYSHRYDSVEYCSPIIYDTITIRNNGNIACEVLITADNKAIKLENKAIKLENNKVSIDKFSEVHFPFSIVPNEISKNGDNRYNIEFKNLTCPNAALYSPSIFKVHKDLAIERDNIVFDNLWAELTFKDSTKVKSLSNVPIQISSVELSGEGTKYITHKGLAKGDILAPNEPRTIHFTLSNMPEFTVIDAKLKIQYNSICEHNKAVSLSGEVPEEVYYIKIRTEKYRVRPKDTFSINIICNDTIPSYVPIDSIKFQIKMDRFLVSWQDLNYNDSKFKYTTDNDGLYLTLANPQAARYIKSPDQVISISSLPILGVPDTTTISLLGTEIFSPKKVIPIIENGFLTLIDYCEPSATHNRLQYFVAEAKISEKSNSVFIEYSTSENIDLYYQVSDALGRVIEEGSLPANMNGIKEISKTYTQSVYFVRVFHQNQLKAQKAILIYNR